MSRSLSFLIDRPAASLPRFRDVMSERCLTSLSGSGSGAGVQDETVTPMRDVDVDADEAQALHSWLVLETSVVEDKMG